MSHRLPGKPESFGRQPRSSPSRSLFDFFVNGMFVTVWAELFQFHPRRIIPTILLSGIARNSTRALGRICAALRAF